MSRSRLGRVLVVCTLLFAVAGQARASDDPLPAPRAMPTPMEVILPPVFYRPSRYEVWQNYAVDRRGHFRPLVIAAPSGPYYYHSGKPYPYAFLTSLVWLPFVAR